MTRLLLISAICTALSACATLPTLFTPTAEPISAPAPRPVLDAPVPDVPAPVAPAPSGSLGDTVVTLGAPTDPGLWVKTRLVSTERAGRVVTATGRRLDVTLRPLDNGTSGGDQMSLTALQTLGLPLAGLAPVTLIATP